MTTIQTSAVALHLDPATYHTMLDTMVEALPQRPGATAEQRARKCEAAIRALTSLHPRDPLEAMLAARIIALHYHSMYDLACANQASVPGPLQLRCEARGQALGRQSDAMRADYLKRQKTEPPRSAGLPACVGAPEPQGQPTSQPQPVAQDAGEDAGEVPVTGEAAAKPAATARPATARPAAAASAARPPVAPVPVARGAEAALLAALERIDAEAEVDLEDAALARAA